MAKKKKDEISNFIDMDEKVFLLDDKDIFHDIPFENSYSGSITVDIVAKNAIFIRNHYVEEDEPFSYKDANGEPISKKFCHHNGIPYIPSTSIKGMVRNLLEIMSYAKLKGKTSDEYLEAKTEKSSNHQSEKLDLSEVIFGTTELKGRVQFSHFKVHGAYKEDSEKEEILMTPEAKKKKFGWKNYPILNSEISSKKGNNEEVVTHFIPLQKGVKFRGKLRFHNLRDFELGAILSALSFHNTEQCFHNIGMAKSLGYGKIDIQFQYDKLDEVLQAFEEKMNIELFDGKVLWHKSVYIKELLRKHSKNNAYEFQALSDVAKLKMREEEKEQEKLFQKELTIVLSSDNPQILQNFINKHPNHEKIDEIKNKKDAIENANKENRHKEVNEKADRAYEALQKKQGKQKQYLKEKEKFVKKWSKDKENKGSEYILELLKKLK